MKINFIGLLMIVLFLGCAGSPAKLAMMSEDDLKKEKTHTLCNAYGNKVWRTEKVKNELIARAASHKQEFKDIFKLPDQGKITNDPEETQNNSTDRTQLLIKWGTKESPPENWEWDLIENEKIRVGMSKCGLLASWGKPGRINRSSHGPAQWVYGGSGNRSYVYVRGGKIKSWQN